MTLGTVTPSLQCCPAGTSVLLCNGTCQGACSSFWTCFHPSPVFPWVTPREHRRLPAAAPTPSLVRDAAHGVGRDGTGWEGTGRVGKGQDRTAPARFSHFQCQGWVAGAACSPKGPPHEERVSSPAPGAVNYSLHPNGSSLDGLAEPARCCPVCRALTSAEELVLTSLQLLQSCFSACA